MKVHGVTVCASARLSGLYAHTVVVTGNICPGR